MTKEKWLKILNDEYYRYFLRRIGYDYNPENWEHFKSSMLTFIEGIDKATEVYFMENDK